MQLRAVAALEAALWLAVVAAAAAVWRDAERLGARANEGAVDVASAVVQFGGAAAWALTADADSPPQASRHAFASLCVGEEVLDGALVMFHSLRRTGTTADLVAMVHGLGAPALARLRAVGVRTVSVEPLDVAGLSATAAGLEERRESMGRRDAVLWSKLRAWQLEEYDKVVLMDLDLVVLANVDELFGMPELAGSPAQDAREKVAFYRSAEYGLTPGNKVDRDSKDQSWTGVVPGWSGLNSGVTVLAPSNATFGSLLNELSILPSRPCCPSQEFLYNYFEERRRFYRLPNVYNSRRASDSPSDNSKHVKVHHFVGAKPWKKKDRSAMNKMWWALHEEVYAILSESGLRPG